MTTFPYSPVPKKQCSKVLLNQLQDISGGAHLSKHSSNEIQLNNLLPWSYSYYICECS